MTEAHLYVSSKQVRDGSQSLFHQSKRCANFFWVALGRNKSAFGTPLLVVEVDVYRLFLMRRIGTLALSQAIEHHGSLLKDEGAYTDAEGALKQKTGSV